MIKGKSSQLPWPCCNQETPLPQWLPHHPGPLASRWQSLSTTWHSLWSPFFKMNHEGESGQISRTCLWLARAPSPAPAGSLGSQTKSYTTCSRFSLCAQLLNLVSRGKGDGPQVFLLNIVSKDGSHLSNDFFVSWKIHIHSFKWEHIGYSRVSIERLWWGHGFNCGCG